MSEVSATRKAALWVGAVFILGTALGGVLGYIFAHHSVSASMNASLSEPERRARRVQQLTSELNLTNEQQQRLDAILLQVHSEFKTLHEQSDTQIDQARQKGRDQIRAILTPDQKPKFEELLKRMDEERKREAQQQGGR
jgi:Spy/CpxP family protein refolding chaperone